MTVAVNRYPTREEIVRRAYSLPEVVAAHARVDLWPSEKVLTSVLFEPGQKILDVACGAGRTAIPLAEMGYAVTGIDIVPEMIESGKRSAALLNLDIEFQVMDASQIEFTNKSFDHVFFNSYEIIPGRMKRAMLLNEIFRVLRPGGYLILECRSGVAFPKRWLLWPWIVIRACLLKPFGAANPHMELRLAGRYRLLSQKRGRCR